MKTQKRPALGLSTEESALLRQYRFDYNTFASLRQDLVTGRFTPERNYITQPLTPPEPDDLKPWPEGAEGAACVQRGNEALFSGEAATLILNGGMATRFGGVVKGIVEALPGQSFLALKLLDLRSSAGPIFVLNSFATDAATRAHLSTHDFFGLDPGRLQFIDQTISLRLQPDGELFRDATGRPSFYAPGHGDLFFSLATATPFQRFRDAGGRYLLVSNVDNLGATVSAKVLGAHILRGNPVTCEVVKKQPGDRGGAPARIADRLCIVEGFRTPPDFDSTQLPVFNTNTFVIDVDAIQPDYPLTWFRADKMIENRDAVQFERLLGEVTAFVPCTYLEVPRQGQENRFLPVKTPEDLATLRPALRARRDAQREQEHA